MTETKSPSELMFLFPEAQGTDLAFSHKQAIVNCMDIPPYIIHHYFWSTIRFNRQEINYCLSVLTPTTIIILKPKNPKEANYEDREMTKLVSFNLKDIQLIGHSKDSKVLLKVEGKDNFNICYPNEKSGLNLQFAQCVYRNYSINFSVYKDQSFVEVRSDHMNNFPEVNIYLSPSQRFQFLYYSLCAENKVPYSHVIVKYVHSLIMRGVPIIDLNNVPIQLISHFKHGSNLKPFIQAISMMPFVTGFCCENITQPSLMDSIKMLFRKGSKVSILHVPHSGMETGISTLSRAVKKTTSLSYLNLEGNQFDDIDSINSVLSTIKKDLYYLNLSDTGLSAEATTRLFITLQDFKKLQELSIAGCETNEAVFEQFNNYVTKLTASKKVNFNSIDVSNTENANGFLDVINDHKLQLRSLKLRKINIGQETTGLLISIIKNSKTLRYLDLSETTISLENIANVINTIAKNNKLSHFHLILDSLNLTTGNLLPLFEAFLNGDLSKWSCLSFNSNNMKEPDLKNLIALLARMPNLHTLSIGDNFTSEMDKIGQILVKLRRIENLRELNLAGGDEKKLGKNMLPLLDSLSTFPALESLDISNNDGGDVLYDKLKGIATTKKGVHSLKIDKNRPTSIDIVQILIKLIKGTRILSLPFPTDDVESMLAAIKDPNDASIALNEYLKAENELFYIIDDNRIRKNLLPQLPFHPSPEIKKIIIKATQEMRDRLESDEEEPLHHSLVCLDYGLELPYNSLSIIAETIETDQSYKKSYKLYNSSNLYKFAREPEEDFKVPIVDDLDSIPDMFSDDGKKGKKKRKSPSESSSEEEQPKKKSKRSQKKSSESDESSSEEEQPKKKSKRSQKKSVESDESSSEEEQPKKKSKRSQKKSESEDESSSEEEQPKKKSKRSQKKSVESDESSSEEEQPKKKSKRSQKKSESEDESSSEEEQPKKKSKRSQKKSESEDESSSEEEQPKKKSKRSQKKSVESSSEEEQPKKKSKRSQKKYSESDESSSEEEQPKKKSKRSQKKSESEGESSSEEEQPKKKSKRSQKKSVESSSEEEQPKKKSKRSQKKSVESDESSSEEEQPKKKSKRSQKNLDESSSEEEQEKKRSNRSQKVFSPSKEKKSSKPRVTFPDNDFEETPKGSNRDSNDHKPINVDDFSDDEIPATPTGTFSDDDDELPSDREPKGSPNGSKNRPNHPKPDDPETVRENLSKMKKPRKK